MDAAVATKNLDAIDASVWSARSPYHRSALAPGAFCRSGKAVAKVFSEQGQQVVDSAHAIFTRLIVANIITYETCQGLYFLPFGSLERHSARYRKSVC